MSAAVQVIPPGFLGFFQLKSLGLNPTEMLGTIAPNLEMFDWYMQARQELLLQSGALPVVALNTSALGFQQPGTVVQVPETEIWYVINCTGASETLGAGDTLGFSIAWGDTSSFFFNCPPGERQPAIAGVATGKQAMATASNFWMPPGARLGIQVQEVISAAGTVDVSLALRHVRMRL